MIAKKLPSGSYRVQVYNKATGKRESITRQTKKEAERAAALWYLDNKTDNGLTFGNALNQYIENRSAVLSPGTIREYRRTVKYFTDLSPVLLDKITSDYMQKYINDISATGVSPKTVANIYGLASAVFKNYLPDKRITVTLPKKTRPDISIPTEAEIKLLIAAAAGRSIEIPLLLAVFCTMRRGEISALTLDDIKGNVIHVSRTYTLAPGNRWVLKPPKSYAGDRFITCPEWIIEKIRQQGYVTNLLPSAITSAFVRLCELAGVRKYRFHDMRHFSSSYQHSIGIPDYYIMQAAGWSSDKVLKNIYRHAIAEEKARNVDIWLNAAESLRPCEVPCEVSVKNTDFKDK